MCVIYLNNNTMEFLFAFIGGIILNIMPCVFPVLSLKIIALVEQRSSNIISGLSYTVGVLVSLFIVSGILIILRKIGFVVGWGYGLQSPTFVMLLSYLLFVVGLNLSGFFSIPMFSIKELDLKNTLGSFFTGVLAVLVATPCTAPFMATAIGFAFAQPPITNLLIFQVLGLGFALPYLLLSIFPNLLSFLPKPGLWMEKFKEFLAFPMYLSSVWLLWVVVRQTSSNLVLTVMSGAVLIVFTIWVWNIVGSFKALWRHFFIVLLIFIDFTIFKISYDLINHAQQEKHVVYSGSVLNTLLDQRRKILVVVTADWCITCKINETLVLSSNIIQDAIKKSNIVYLLADWTKRDKKITDYVKGFNRIGVPLYVLYDSRGEYKILPQILTQKIVLQELERLK